MMRLNQYSSQTPTIAATPMMLALADEALREIAAMPAAMVHASRKGICAGVVRTFGSLIFRRAGWIVRLEYWDRSSRNGSAKRTNYRLPAALEARAAAMLDAL